MAPPSCDPGGGVVESPFDDSRDSRHQAAVGDLGSLQDDGVGADHALNADAGLLEDDGIHAHQGPIADLAALELGSVPHGHLFADAGGRPAADVDHAVVLHAGARPDDDPVLGVVSTKHRAEPDAGLFADGHVSHEDGVGGDESGIGDARPLPVEGQDDGYRDG